jgi:SpoIID/LytB domain protein
VRREHLLHRRAIPAAAALVVALAILPAGRADADTVFTFEGGGFGHSVGLSQFGAYGMALDGYGWQDILTHYYTGTSVQPADPRFTAAPIWVGIVQEHQTVEFLVRSIGEGAVPVTVTRNTKTLTARPGETITVEQIGDGRCRVTTPSGYLTGGCEMTLEWDGWEESPTTALELRGCSLPDWNAPGGTVYKPCTYARGTMHVNPDNNTQTVDVSLEIDVDDYVLGISESPYGWGDTGGMAALQAQAVAARSYAIHRAVDRGDPQDRPWCWCQIYDTPVDQNYVGWGHGTQTWIDAVRSTEGMVVTHPSETYDGSLLPIEAFYSSSTFGWTENSEHGFGAYVPYLRNVDDHWSLDPAVYNHSARWTRQFSATTLASRLPGMSTVTGLEVTGCSPSGAALEITFTGSGGPRTFTTRQLRGYLGLRSMQVIRAGSPLPGEPACPQPGEAGGEAGEGGPVVLTQITFDDDTAGDSFGDADGTAECGETIEAFTTIRNDGAALSGVGATLSSDDPYVSVRWNTTSTFPDLEAGGTAANDGDWDLEIASETPTRHQAVLTLQVSADGAGPWEMAVTIPVRCGAPEAAATVGIGDLNGNGSPEVATAVRTPRGRWHLKARDAATGSKVTATQIATPQWEVVELERLPGHPTQVVALLDRGGRTRVVIADLDGGDKVRLKMGARGDSLGATPVQLADGRSGVAVLIAWGDGVRLKVSAADGTPISKRNLRIVPEGAEIDRLGDLDGDGGTEVAVVGRRFSGQTVAFVMDPGDGSHLGMVRFGSTPPAGAVTLASDPGGPRDTIAVAQEAGDGSLIRLADARTGDDLGSSRVPIAHPVDIEALPSLSEGPAVAILGTSADGSPSAIVTNPYRARVLSGPVFDVGNRPVDLTVLSPFGPSGAALAGLGTSGDSSTIELRDALSGDRLGSVRVP